MKITQPAPNTRFRIAANTTPPTIELATDTAGPHSWAWTIAWDRFTRSGAVETAGNRLTLGAQIANLGGVLTVTATRSRTSASVRLNVVGTNPTMADITLYLSTKAGSDGFGAIIAHESRGVHFDGTGVPVKSFDNGYGVCQLTSPAPTFEQCWSWKLNIDAGLALFAVKRRSAINYLSQGGRGYTADQLRYETVCRWNGGSYHRWTGTAWARNPNILCDARTGNIGWDMSDPDNAGQTEAALRRRDQATYRRGRRNTDEWNYFGVCYADAVLG